MNLVFIPVVVALTGLFGLAFAIYGVLTNLLVRTHWQTTAQQGVVLW